MPDSVATITVNTFPNGHDLTFNHFHVYGTIAIGAGNYPVNGLPLLWNTIASTIASGVAPSWVEFFTIGSPPGVYDYTWDSKSDTLRILEQNASASTGTAPFSEFPIGTAIPPLVTNDLIAFHAIFRRA